MSLRSDWKARVLSIAGLALAAAVPVHAAGTLFGPQTYTRSGGAPDQFSDSFSVPAATGAVVWIQNGDGSGGNRASSVDVLVNGTAVAGPADFAKPVDLVAKGVALPKGQAALAVTMDGEPGSMITVTIMPVGFRPDIEVGRLIVPYASGSSLTLSLKNGSRHRRSVKVLFYDDAGNVVAWSDRLDLAPHGAFSRSVTDLIATGSFASGSIEVLYAGPGPGRLFGQATVKDDLTGVDAVAEMQQAGSRRIDPLDAALKFSR